MVETPRHGVRYELTLVSEAGADGAVYDVVVAPAGANEARVRVEIVGASARVTQGGERLTPAHTEQLVAIAKAVGRRADDAPWPRRVQRWKQVGVR